MTKSLPGTQRHCLEFRTYLRDKVKHRKLTDLLSGILVKLWVWSDSLFSARVQGISHARFPMPYSHVYKHKADTVILCTLCHLSYCKSSDSLSQCGSRNTQSSSEVSYQSWRTSCLNKHLFHLTPKQCSVGRQKQFIKVTRWGLRGGDVTPNSASGSLASAALIGLVFWAFLCKQDQGLCKCAVQTQSLLTVASGCAGMWDKGWVEGLHLFLSIKTASILFVLYEILAQSIQRKNSEALRICFWKAALVYLLVPMLCTPSLHNSKINMNPWVATKESLTPFQKNHW